MHLDAITPALVAIAVTVVLIGWILRFIHQPSVVAYLLAGVALGPYGMGVVTDQDAISQFGSIGVVLLLFFTGMEVSPKRWVSIWKVICIGTFLQIALSLLLVWGLGSFLDWSIQRIILISFVITLSSTAVVIKLLQEWNELNSPLGQSILGILLVQDLALVPMMIIIGSLGSETVPPSTYVLQAVGGIAILSLAIWVTVKDTIHLRFLASFKKDHEMQLFTALLICFGLALFTGLFQLSTALGAFVGGLVVGAAKETDWIQHQLESFKVLTIAFFFLSIGMLMNMDFLEQNTWKIISLVLFVIISNTLLNAFILRLFGSPWRDSLYGGAILSQAGEFGFVIAAIGLTAGIINDMTYQMTILIIALSLCLSPFYIATVRKLVGWKS